MVTVDSKPIKPTGFFPAANADSVKFSDSGRNAAVKAEAGKAPAGDLQSLPKNQLAGSTAAQSGAEAVKTALFSLGLPNDALSQTLLVFSRLFSIAADPGLLSGLRKELLASGPSSPKTAKEKQQLESRVLAALAAFDKDVSLSGGDLEAYAVIPYGGDNSGQDNSDRKREFYGYLNRIPGKNGRHWVVLPFNYSSGGTELKVLVRILIKGSLLSSEKGNDEGLVITDIAGPKRKWRFLLNKTGEKINADVSIVPGLSPEDSKNLEKFIKNDLKFAGLRVHNGEEMFLADEFAAEVLPVVNKEV